MHIPIYHIDTFTDKLFTGNPAAVCILSSSLPDTIFQNITKENNLPVTAFLIRENDHFAIRWFTPEYELDLCGHGTLAAAYVVFNFLEPEWEKVDLHSATEVLTVVRKNDLITLDFPVKNIEPCDVSLLAPGLGLTPKECFQHTEERCLAILNTIDEVKNLQPRIEVLKKLPYRGVTVTALGTDSDFVSRTFYPHKNIWEDSVTGASHCLLVPYWADKLNKTQLHALQLSPRGGEMFCELANNRVLMSGKAKLYLQAVLSL